MGVRVLARLRSPVCSLHELGSPFFFSDHSFLHAASGSGSRATERILRRRAGGAGRAEGGGGEAEGCPEGTAARLRPLRQPSAPGALTFASSVQKHGIVLGPDLSVSGGAGADDTPGAEPESRSAPDPQASPAEGNGMLGKKPPRPPAARLHRPAGASFHCFQRTFDFWSLRLAAARLFNAECFDSYAGNRGDPPYFSQN